MKIVPPVGRVLLGLLVGWGLRAHAVEMYDNRTTREDFIRYAEQMPYLTLESVLYNRSDWELDEADPGKAKLYQELLRKVCNRAYPAEMLESLIVADPPKVKTLAMVALFDREEPAKFLGIIARHCDDKDETFKTVHWPRPSQPRTPEQIMASLEAQTVGRFATALVDAYLNAAEIKSERRGETTQDLLDRYMIPRQRRPFCLDWYEVQLDRAGGGGSPTEPDRIPAIRGLRERIHQLPLLDRTWTLLAMWRYNGAEYLATEDELVEACRQVGPRKLMRMLQGGIMSADPDVQSGTRGYENIRYFVLRHAAQLLRPQDSENLLDCEEPLEHESERNPWWAVAAAHLETPERGRQILHEALPRFQGEYRGDALVVLHAALWEIGGEAETRTVTDWFYDPVTATKDLDGCRGLIHEAETLPHGKSLLACLVRDPRYEKLPRGNFAEMAWVVGRWTQNKPVNYALELNGATPETAERLKTRLRETAPSWSKDAGK